MINHKSKFVCPPAEDVKMLMGEVVYVILKSILIMG